MAQLIDIQRVEVGLQNLRARVRVADDAPLMTSEDLQGTTRVYRLMPHIIEHTCLGDAGDTFKACMGNTELAHLLEHVTVELLAQTDIAGDVTSGRTYPVEGDPRAFDVEISCKDDVLTIAALSSAVWLIDWAYTGGGDPVPDVEATVRGLRGLVASLGDEPATTYEEGVRAQLSEDAQEEREQALRERRQQIARREQEIAQTQSAAEDAARARVEAEEAERRAEEERRAKEAALEAARVEAERQAAAQAAAEAEATREAEEAELLAAAAGEDGVATDGADAGDPGVAVSAGEADPAGSEAPTEDLSASDTTVMPAQPAIDTEGTRVMRPLGAEAAAGAAGTDGGAGTDVASASPEAPRVSPEALQASRDLPEAALEAWRNVGEVRVFEEAAPQAEPVATRPLDADEAPVDDAPLPEEAGSLESQEGIPARRRVR